MFFRENKAGFNCAICQNGIVDIEEYLETLLFSNG
jgi:hypothetical protein